MVGRRGISKGCMRCRQRKKGCDLKRPSCGQCLQRGSPCPGYGAGVTFVHDSRSVSSNRSSSAEVRSCSLSLGSTPPSFARSAEQVGLSDHFWYIYLPRRYASPGSHHGSLDDFFQAVEHTSSHEMLSKHAFWALSSLIIGREVSDSRLLVQGSRMYSKALKELRAAIENVQNMSMTSSAEMALTCNLLALYEIFDDPSQTRFGFFTHSQGLAQLVQLRGPSGFRAGVASAAFQGVRPAIIVSAIQRRKATYLSSDEWCTSPWQFQSKPPWQKVLDITAQVPELLEKFDQIQRITFDEDKQTRSLELLKYCQTIDGALQAWYQELPRMFGLEPSTKLWLTKERSTADSLLPIEIHFEDLQHGQALILYWATSIFVYSTMRKLHQGLTSTVTSEWDPTLSFGYSDLLLRNDPYYAATRIVQSIPYFLQPGVGMLMRKIFVIPLTTAYAYFASFSDMSDAPAWVVAGVNEFEESPRCDVSETTLGAEDIKVDAIQSYLEDTAKAMHIHGIPINIFCVPNVSKQRSMARLRRH